MGADINIPCLQPLLDFAVVMERLEVATLDSINELKDLIDEEKGESLVY